MWKRFFRTYEVSDKGEVRNAKTKHILKDRPDKDGYRVIVISFGKRGRRTVKIHREVAAAFISNPFNLPQVNHLDGNKSNNTPSNLEWCTSGDNLKHALATGLRSPTWTGRKGKLHGASKPVVRVDGQGNVLEEYESVSEASNKVGAPETSCISAVCKRKRNSYYGQIFRYKDDTSYK